MCNTTLFQIKNSFGTYCFNIRVKGRRNRKSL